MNEIPTDNGNRRQNLVRNMKQAAAIVLLIFSSDLTSKAQVKDTIYLLNTAILIGSLEEISLGIIQFDADGVGDVNIKNEKIRTFSAHSYSYRIETSAKRIYFGFIKPSTVSGSVILITGRDTIELRLREITSLIRFGNSLASRLFGEFGGGYSFTKSSDIGRFNLNADFTYSAKKFDFIVEGDMILTGDSAGIHRERENVQVTGLYTVGASWLAGILLSYQRSIQLGIKRRFQQGAGGGYKFLQTRRSLGSAITGVVVNQEWGFTRPKLILWEWVLDGKYDFFSFSKPDLTISTGQTAYFGLTQKGRIRYDATIAFKVKLIEDFVLGFNVYSNYDSKSPATLSAKTDYGFIVNFDYTF